MNNRELATVLAALRYWQLRLTGEAPGDDFDDIAGHYGPPLTADDIDGLCERLNTDRRDNDAWQVSWEIDIFEADNALDAARQALAMQRDPTSTATVFNVSAPDGTTTVEDVQ